MCLNHLLAASLAHDARPGPLHWALQKGASPDSRASTDVQAHVTVAQNCPGWPFCQVVPAESAT